MSLFSLLSVARDGLVAQSAGVSTVGQNIANANTPGYVRRGVTLATRPIGGASMGGVEVVGTTRSFDRVSHRRVTEEHGRRGAADARAGTLASVESIVTPGTGGVGPRVNSFFQSLDSWSGLAGDTSARLGVLQEAAGLAQEISGAAADLDTLRGDLFAQAQGVAGEVSERLGRIASLNTAIAEATGRGESGADLRDQRDQLVLEVGDRLGARAVEDASGQVTLFSAGTVLVEGGRASSVSVDLGPGGSLRVQAQPPGGQATDVTAQVTQGTLGGLREARDVDIPRAQAGLDQFAFDLATAMNSAHSSGFGLDGSTGRPLFTTTATATGAARALALNPALDGHPERLAASATSADLPGGNAIALRLAGMSSRPLGTGSATPAERFGSVAADVGTRRAAADSEAALRADTVLQAENLHESTSGVSMDEEMVNLTRFQRAFEASTRVLRVADELLDNLMKSI
jgi:flagellar hook-associated protein 1 FlgK